MDTENDAMGHVLVDIVTDRIDATNLMNVEGHGTPHPGRNPISPLVQLLLNMMRLPCLVMGLKACLVYFACFFHILSVVSSLLPHKLSICVVGRRKNVGEVLSRLYRSPAGKLPVVIPKGRIRPVSAIIAAKFATECYKTVKNHVHVHSHWRKYKGDTRILSDYYNIVGVSIYCRPFARL